MFTRLKELVHSILAAFNIRLSRLHSPTSDSGQLVNALAHHRIDLVFDIGANEGQFALSIRKAGYRGRIVCFEPLPEAHRVLLRKTRNDENIIVHPRTAIGNSSGNIDINVSKNSVSSSIFEMLPAHANAAPTSVFESKVETPITPLDAVSEPYLRSETRCFLKVDTQGYEWEVLDGASEVLARSSGLMMELSMQPLYRGQHLWRELTARLEEAGFALWALQKGFVDPDNGRGLQVDGLFFRENR